MGFRNNKRTTRSLTGPQSRLIWACQCQKCTIHIQCSLLFAAPVSSSHFPPLASIDPQHHSVPCILQCSVFQWLQWPPGNICVLPLVISWRYRLTASVRTVVGLSLSLVRWRGMHYQHSYVVQMSLLLLLDDLLRLLCSRSTDVLRVVMSSSDVPSTKERNYTVNSTWKVAVSFKIIMTTSVTRPCFTTQHQTSKTKTKTTACKTKTDFLISDRSCPNSDGLRPHHWDALHQTFLELLAHHNWCVLL